tara:strand:- start:860 stop:1129 length:270 start_codon:yes stop_codon:yes gene_type:complete
MALPNLYSIAAEALLDQLKTEVNDLEILACQNGWLQCNDLLTSIYVIHGDIHKIRNDFTGLSLVHKHPYLKEHQRGHNMILSDIPPKGV